MTEETSVHVKLAMADVLGCLLIAWVAFMVAMVGLEQAKLQDTLVAVSSGVGLGLIIVTVIAYLNENLLGTAIFGPLAFFFMAFPAMAGDTSAATTAMAIGFIGVVLILDGAVSLMQPVRLLPILLFIAGLGFLTLALYWNGGDKAMLNLTGVLMLLTSLIAGYLGFAITAMVIKGKPVVPLFIKAAGASS